MAIAVATTATTAYIQSTTPAITMPSGIVSGDLLIVVMNTRTDDTDPTASGWTKVKKQDNQAINAYLGGFVYSKVSNGTEGGSVTFTLGGNHWTSAVCYRITGQASSGAVSANNGANVSSTSTPAFAGAITPTVESSLIIMGIFGTTITNVVGTYAITTSDPGGWTETIDQGSTSPTGLGVRIASAYAIRTQITSTGNFSCSGGSAFTDWAGIIISISPFVAPPTTSNFLAFM